MSVRTSLRRTWPVLLSYGLFSAWGLGCLVASIFFSQGLGGGGDVVALVGIAIATVVGNAAGNALGLVGLRLAIVVVSFIVLFVGGTMFASVLGPIAPYALVAMVAVLSGYLGVASRLDVVAAWFPLSLAVGAAILWLNRHGAVATFETGSKHAIWDPFTMVCLAGTVFFMLVFLATRNSLGLTAWQEVSRRGARLGSAEPAAGVAVARPGRGSIAVLLAFTMVVLGATAAISPYLFRTAEDPDAKNGSKTEQRDGTQGDGHGNGQGQGQGEGNGQGKPDPGAAGDSAREALELGARVLMWLLIAAFILLILLLVLLPPIRRTMLLRHLEKPLWPVAPTPRVMNLWRRACAALASAGVEPDQGETPSAFARRAASAVQSTLGCDVQSLVAAAAIVEKIDYAGRGLGAEDASAMRAAVMPVVHEIEPRVAFRQRVRILWGKAPEVES